MTYNALGRMAQRVLPWTSSGWQNIEYQYGAFGEPLGGSVPAYPEVDARLQLPGSTIAYYMYPWNNTIFVHANALSSATQTTDNTGAVVHQLLYYPWGQIWVNSGTDYWEESFAGQEMYMSESGLSYTPNRMYGATPGRWMSPDPLAGEVTNPQSLNRYAYALNNPTSLVDPSGMIACLVSRPGRRRNAPSPCDAYYDGGGGGSVTISFDGGVGVSPGLFGYGGVGGAGLGGGESAVQCPDNVCSGFGTSASGDTAWAEFVATAGGVNGYYDPEDLTNGIYDFNGQLYDYDNYQALLKQQFASQIAAQCGTLSGNLAADAPAGSGASAICGSVQYIQGGHANFAIDCGSWNGGNCAGRFAGGLHIEGNPEEGFWGHNDTASYFIGSGFNWGTFNPWNLVVHGVVDFIGGNTAVYVFPH